MTMKKYIVEYVELIDGRMEERKTIFYNSVDYKEFIQELKDNKYDGKMILLRNYMRKGW